MAAFSSEKAPLCGGGAAGRATSVEGQGEFLAAFLLESLYCDDLCMTDDRRRLAELQSEAHGHPRLREKRSVLHALAVARSFGLKPASL